MTTFQSVNVGLGPHEHQYRVTTPTTPRAPTQSQSHPLSTPIAEEVSTTTPTRLNFGGVSGQRPLPTSPFLSSFPLQQPSTNPPNPRLFSREHSHRSTQSAGSHDIDMDVSDEGEGASDDESIDAETGRPSKKKKGQKFYCTDFPPCNLSFTRSEHLARHIRKHTGERPFQCHCSRRFSRLDNLRQHAQTVHVNEEIPGDSLAATGTRFQRQIRTDRVRTPTSRSRASTANSQGSHGRGHSRNLSASSIGSTASTISRGDDVRRRPPPLIMSNDQGARSRPTIDTLKLPPSTPPQQAFSKESSEGLSTPTSTTFSNGASSPGYGSTFGSPVSTVSRNIGYWGANSYHGRRLSVPSGPNPFQSPQSNSYPAPYLSPLAPCNSSLASSNSSMYGSPTSSSYSFSRRETPAEAEWRRRTWHPTTYNSYPRPATSGLSFYRTPDDAPQPAFAPQAAATPGSSFGQRLPGIETFDQIPNRSTSPVRRGGSPMQVDSPNKPPIYPGPSATSGPNDRRGHQSWDLSLHQNLTKLDIANSAPTNEASGWTQQLMPEARNDSPYIQDNQPLQTHFPPQSAPVIVHQESPNAHVRATSPTGATSYRSKRQGWYNGPLNAPSATTRRKSPEGSSSSESVPTPSFSTAEYHPSIVGSDGYVEGHSVSQHNVINAVRFSKVRMGPLTQWQSFNGSTQHPTYQYPGDSHTATSQQQHASQDNKMTNLEVLVAVATNEDNARNTNTQPTPI
ncbi:MAG: hypothetical protein L6R38_004176 [Xanthoria sp. 2 TBL-2021]|nr:MAG: hypothetical protein L6R38_004176 [Xanthoria sp. 2 TBL-2021]